MKVYISATQKDLLKYRLAVHAVARRLKIEDVAMEAYGADVKPPLERCLSDVRDCDLYLGLFAWRYGFRPPGQTSSITELEYRAALAAGKPCLVFLLAEDARWPGDMMDRGADSDRILELRPGAQGAPPVRLLFQCGRPDRQGDGGTDRRAQRAVPGPRAGRPRHPPPGGDAGPLPPEPGPDVRDGPG